MQRFVFVFLGGGIGSLARYVMSTSIMRAAAGGFPFGTLAVNLAGAFLIGLIVESLALKFQAPETLRLFLVTGFLGGFTTFSAFSLEATLMMQKGEWLVLAAYILASVLGTLAFVLLATWLVRTFF